MKFIICNRWEAESAKHNKLEEPHVWISIWTPNDKPAKIVENPLCRDVLSLCFHDIERVPTPMTMEDYLLFNEHHASQIIDFVIKYKNDVDLIVVHCDAGVSRSSAVVKALQLWLNNEETVSGNQMYWPNNLVFNTLMDEITGK